MTDKAKVPTHYATADMERRHEHHVCQNHPEPGICVADRGRWPCDARQLLDLAATVKFYGALLREARAVDAEWSAYIGTWDKDGHDDAEKMGKVIGRLCAVLASVDGKVHDPLEASR
jgi:hypothetical protein